MTGQVSICLPIFNGERFLRDAIESLLSQTYTNFELLAVDDCSTDNSVQIVQEYASKDQRVKLFQNSQRLGLFANYNRALELAGGEYIKPFAQDDILHAEMLEKCVEVLSTNQQVALVSCVRLNIDANGRSKHKTDEIEGYQIEKDVPVDGTQTIVSAIKNLTNFIGEPSTVMFRAAFKETGFDCDYHHIGDLDYWLRIIEGRQYYMLGATLCLFRSHPASRSSFNRKGLLFVPDIVRLWSKFSKVVEANGYRSEQFWHFATRAVAAETFQLEQEGQLDHNFLQASYTDLQADFIPKDLAMRLQADSIAFRALLVHSLRSATREPRAFSSNNVAHLRYNTRLILRLEERLTRLLRSPLWTSTKWLRELNKHWTNTDSEPIFFDYAQSKDTLARQEAYIRYLKKEIRAVLKSRSWKISILFRTWSTGEASARAIHGIAPATFSPSLNRK